MPLLDVQKGTWRAAFERPQEPAGIIDHLAPVGLEKAAVVKELKESILRCRAARQPRLTENVAVRYESRSQNKLFFSIYFDPEKSF